LTHYETNHTRLLALEEFGVADATIEPFVLAHPLVEHLSPEDVEQAAFGVDNVLLLLLLLEKERELCVGVCVSE
jgi:hypothetical protein